MKPTAAKPRSNIAQVEGSGTSVVMPGLKTKLPPSSLVEKVGSTKAPQWVAGRTRPWPNKDLDGEEVGCIRSYLQRHVGWERRGVCEVRLADRAAVSAIANTRLKPRQLVRRGTTLFDDLRTSIELFG